MENKINLFNDIWCNVLFENRNQAYGAFVIRKDSSKRHLLAMLVTLSFLVLLLMIPSFLNKVIPDEHTANNRVTEFGQWKVEAPVEKISEVILAPTPKPKAPTIKFVPPVITPDDKVPLEEEMISQDDLIGSKATISDHISEETVVHNFIDVTSTTYKTVTDAPLIWVEQMPEFPGGKKALLKYLAENIHYPELAAENGIFGMVIIQFVVNTSGQLVNFEIKRNVAGGCSEEALRVVKSMPKWIPGKQNGNAVRVMYTLPVRFVLNK